MTLAIISSSDMSSAVAKKKKKGRKKENHSSEIIQLKEQNIFLTLLFTIKILKDMPILYN